jgi:hypothetical protein
MQACAQAKPTMKLLDRKVQGNEWGQEADTKGNSQSGHHMLSVAGACTVNVIRIRDWKSDFFISYCCEVKYIQDGNSAKRSTEK